MNSRLKICIGVFSFCLILTAIFVASTVSVSAAEVVDSGTCGDNLTWSLDSDGTLTISGSGKMKDYYVYDGSTSTPPWYSYRIQIKAVVISDGVTSIGSSAFEGCSSLTSTDIPDGVTSIGDSAFHNCSSLTSINIPDGVTSIGDWAFHNCSSLKDVYISDVEAWLNISFGDSYSSHPNYYGNLIILDIYTCKRAAVTK